MISSTIFAIVLLIFFISLLAKGQNDFSCLREFKSSISSPTGLLSSWNFDDTSVGAVCSFTGVDCWNPNENRILSINLSSTALSGPIPSALRLCSSLTTLDLSVNYFYGPIPSSLCSWLPYLVTLDLSSNSLTGPIPPQLFNCKFLNSLILSGNYLSGSIPATVSNLGRLKTLNLSSNNLVGQIPSALALYDSSSFANNPFLCGQPRSSECPYVMPTRTILIFVAFGFFGFVSSLLISYFVWSFCFAATAETVACKELDQLTLQLLQDGLIRERLAKNQIEMLTLGELMTATRDFHPENIMVVGDPSTGTSYEGVLPDGSGLIVKRLLKCTQRSGRQFRTEMSWIKEICHPNLVSLLGVCTSMEERFVMYQTMFNGALSVLLQSRDEILDWERRLKIGIGVARGLAWLHHGYQVPLLHCSLCSSAVLLDEYYEPRIADFGLARRFRSSLVDDDDNDIDSSCSSSMCAAPDNAHCPLPSTKDDVYDFGVILLELATGQCVVNANSNDLVRLVLHKLFTGRICEAIDNSLKGKGNEEEIVEFLEIACQCVVDYPRERPPMIEVYPSLKRIGTGNDFSENLDESCIISGEDSSDVAVKLAYSIYAGRDPYL